MSDLELAGTVEGSESLPVLILGNSLGTTTSMWDPQASALARHFRLLRFDWPGHGSPANYIAVDAVHNVLYQPTFPAPLSDAININTVDPATGTIAFVDITAQFQEQNAEAMLVDFSGDYLYMVDNFTGSESSPTAVGSFAIDPVTGQLSPLGTHYETASHNSYPSLAVVP